MDFQLTPVPYSLATADNSMIKTDKSASFHFLTKNVEDIETPSDKSLTNPFTVTKRLGDWPGFLSNDENKPQLVKILLQVWSSDCQAGKLMGRNVFLVCEGKAYKLSSSDGLHTESTVVEQLTSTQEETNSRVTFSTVSTEKIVAINHLGLKVLTA